MDAQRGFVRSTRRAKPLTPSPVILPAEALAVMLLIVVVTLGLMTRSGA